MKYFKQEDYNRCLEFLKGKPETVETQQELYKFMHDECQLLPAEDAVTVKDLGVYAKAYDTVLSHEDTPNWCSTLSDGSQVVWNRKHQTFYQLEEIGMTYCSWSDYFNDTPEMSSIDKWLLENWSDWKFSQLQRKLVAIWNGKFDQYFRNFWR